MQDQNYYEYSVIRYVPNVEREEFVNVGLAMMCKRRRWIKVELHIDRERICALWPDTDISALELQLQSFVGIAAGLKSAGPLSQYPVEERFRWISAVKSCVIQTSRPHPGMTPDLEYTFARLLADLVL